MATEAPTEQTMDPSDQAEALPPVRPLRREALLPAERTRGLGAVAVVCTMAGVASGLALATTLMAMQVADSMAMRGYPYRVVSEPDHGFLGVLHRVHDGVDEVIRVVPDSPASMIALRPHDHLVAIDGIRLRSVYDLERHTRALPPGAQVTLIVERQGVSFTMHPVLVSAPQLNY